MASDKERLDWLILFWCHLGWGPNTGDGPKNRKEIDDAIKAERRGR